MGYDMYRITDDGDDPADPHATPGGYFRLNTWGMWEVQPKLINIGIVRESNFPDMTTDEEQWRHAITGPEGPGVCMHKLCSNDGWVVTHLEISSGIAYANEHHPGWRENLPDNARAFVEWMEHSPYGFEVW